MTDLPEPDLIPAWVGGKLMPIGKLRAHREGIRHKAISVFVIDGGHILLQRRALTKYHTPGLWANTCCTHPHWEEPADICAQRRLEEELGIRGLDLLPRGTLEYRADVGNDMIEHEVVDLFIAHADQTTLSLQLNPTEVMQIRWVPLDGLKHEIESNPARFTPWLRIYMADHASQLFGTN